MALSSHLHWKKSSASRLLQTLQRLRGFDGDDDSGSVDIDTDSDEDGDDDDDDGTDIDREDSGSEAECRMEAPVTGIGIGKDIGIVVVYEPLGEEPVDVEDAEVDAVGVVSIDGDADGSDDEDGGDADVGVMSWSCAAAPGFVSAARAHFEQSPFFDGFA